MGDRKAFFTSIDAAPQSALAHGRGRILHLVDPSTGSHRLDVHVNLINDDRGPGRFISTPMPTTSISCWTACSKSSSTVSAIS